MIITNQPDEFESGIDGAAPQVWFGIGAPDGTRGAWVTAPVGSQYCQKSATDPRWWVKVKNNGRTDDWAQGVLIISETVLVSQFTDGGGTSGTFALTKKIPAGAFALQAVLVNVTGFTGNTSAVITVGDGSDVDRYNTGTPSVFTTAAAIDLGVPSGTKIHTAETTITITITGGTDFTAITAGQLTIRIYLLN